MTKPSFVVYSKDGCTFCEKLAAFMESKGISYTKYQLGVDYTRDEFIAEFGAKSTFPRVVLGEEVIGGMKETVKYLVENKYV